MQLISRFPSEEKIHGTAQKFPSLKLIISVSKFVRLCKIKERYILCKSVTAKVNNVETETATG